MPARGSSALSPLSDSGINTSDPIMLYLAADQGHSEVVRVLVAAGADVDKTTPFEEETPLVAATKNRHLQTVLVLIASGADVNKNNAGLTPFYFAANNGHLKIVQALVAAGAEVLQHKRPGSPPLLIAAQHDLLEFFSLLPPELASLGADESEVLAFLRCGRKTAPRAARSCSCAWRRRGGSWTRSARSTCTRSSGGSPICRRRWFGSTSCRTRGRWGGGLI